MSETNKKYTYFASDFHLGAPNDAESLQRVKKLLPGLHLLNPVRIVFI